MKNQHWTTSCFTSSGEPPDLQVFQFDKGISGSPHYGPYLQLVMICDSNLHGFNDTNSHPEKLDITKILENDMCYNYPNTSENHNDFNERGACKSIIHKYYLHFVKILHGTGFSHLQSVVLGALSVKYKTFNDSCHDCLINLD